MSRRNKIIATIVSIILVVLIIRACSPDEKVNSYDGKCDTCGRKTDQRYAGHEICWKCYENMNKEWYKNHK